MISQKAIDQLTFAYVAVVVLGSTVIYWLLGTGQPSKVQGSEIGSAAEKALELSSDLTHQLVTLATAAIGACIWILTRPLTNDRELVERLIWALAALFLFTASMYFGFIQMDATLASLALGMFDPRDDIVWWPQTLQYYSFVAGAAVLGLACLRSINAIVERK